MKITTQSTKEEVLDFLKKGGACCLNKKVEFSSQENKTQLCFFTDISETLINDPEIAIALIKQPRSHLDLAQMPEQWRKNKEIAIAAIAESNYHLQYLSQELKKDPEVVFAAVAHPISLCHGGHGAHPQDIDLWEFVDPLLKNDEEFRQRVKNAVLPYKINGISMQVLSGFVIALGIASVALALATISLSALGISGVVIAGVATITVGATFFNKGNNRAREERLYDYAMSL